MHYTQRSAVCAVAAASRWRAFLQVCCGLGCAFRYKFIALAKTMTAGGVARPAGIGRFIP